MTDDTRLELTIKDGNSSLSLSKVRSALIARGRRDAEAVVPHAWGDGYRLILGSGVIGQGEFPTLVLRRAEEGDADAQVTVGTAYLRGEGVAQDYPEAVKWYRRAAERGNYCAQFFLGWAYAYGRGVTRDDAEAVKWFRRAADAGHPDAQIFLGRAYTNGIGVDQDYGEAVRWWRIAMYAADLDCQSGEAHYMLGHAYFNGHGVPQDYVVAYMWYALAAEYSKWNASDEETKRRAKSRDDVARKLTLQQLAEAQRLALEENEGPELDFTVGSGIG
jgi:TPR repeat protein